MKIAKKMAMIYLVFWLLATLSWQLNWLPFSNEPRTSEILQLPSLKNFFGGDALGRDLLARILEGASVSFGVGAMASLSAMGLAVVVGILGTWWRPQSGMVLFVIDLLQALPSYVVSTLIFILVHGVWSSPGGSVGALVVALALTHWMSAARLFRAQCLQLQNATFIESSRALGAGHWQILWTHGPRHLKSTFLISWALQWPVLLMYESFMSFIGFGVESPYTSWGLLMQEGWRYLEDYPHLLLGPGFVLFTVLLAMNFIFDSYRGFVSAAGIDDPPNADSKATATEMARWSSP